MNNCETSLYLYFNEAANTLLLDKEDDVIHNAFIKQLEIAMPNKICPNNPLKKYKGHFCSSCLGLMNSRKFDQTFQENIVPNEAKLRNSSKILTDLVSKKTVFFDGKKYTPSILHNYFKNFSYNNFQQFMEKLGPKFEDHSYFSGYLSCYEDYKKQQRRNTFKSSQIKAQIIHDSKDHIPTLKMVLSYLKDYRNFLNNLSSLYYLDITRKNFYFIKNISIETDKLDRHYVKIDILHKLNVVLPPHILAKTLNWRINRNCSRGKLSIQDLFPDEGRKIILNDYGYDIKIRFNNSRLLEDNNLSEFSDAA